MIGFLADECFPSPLRRSMLAAGFDVTRSADMQPGASDQLVLALAFAQSRVLITEDNDFGDLVVRLGLQTHGVIRVALKPLNRAAQSVRLVQALIQLGDRLSGAFVTIEPKRTRVRQIFSTTP